MDFDDMEKILKDTMIGKQNHRVYNFDNCAFPDSGVSADIPGATMAPQSSSGDRIAALEGKLARLENRPSNTRTDRDTRDRKKTHDKPMVRGLDVCWDFNSKHGCKRPTTPGGCKTDKKEYAHACNIWVKSKSAYCLMPHGRKSHR